MDGLSAAASGFAVISLALQLAGGILKLYDFWGTVQDAPTEVAEMLLDLKLLSGILDELVTRGDPSPHVKDALEHCNAKVELLLSIVRELEPNFGSNLRRVRMWTAFKAARKKQKLRRFRDSLQETKTTLLLALMPQFQLPPVYVEETVVEETTRNAKEIISKVKPSAGVEKLPEYSASQLPDTKGPDLKFTEVFSVSDTQSDTRQLPEGLSASDLQATIETSLRLAAESYFRGGAFARAMQDTVHRVANLQTTYRCAQGYDKPNDEVHEPDSAAPKSPSVSSRDVLNPGSMRLRANQSRIFHKTSATGTLFGTIWLRTTYVRVDSQSKKSVDVVSSFTFYPSWWLTKFGMRYGMEGTWFSTPSGWQFNFNPIRAVPDNSPIFHACHKGSLSTVQFLISEGSASVRDTDSRGWTPLHYAAVAESESNVDLCEFLISEGADKTALAFKGPSEHALSPVTLFTASSKKRPAELKIKMLRLFEDCIDMSEPNSDGWTIIGDLVGSFNQESAPANSNSIFWFLRSMKWDSMVGFGPKTIWHGLQHAVRSFVDLERQQMVVKNRLDLMVGREFPSSYATAIMYWIVLRAIGNKLLPLLLAAGSFMHIEGYDYDQESEVDPTVLAKHLPYLYDEWCKVFTTSLESTDEVLNLELDAVLEQAGWTEDALRKLTLQCNQECENWRSDGQLRCGVCDNNYSILGVGLVQPRWVEFEECTSSGHKQNCVCKEFLQAKQSLGLGSQSSNYNGEETQEDSDSDEDTYYNAESEQNLQHLASDLDEYAWMTECDRYRQGAEKDTAKDPFFEVTARLYRTQARKWLGIYEPGELLCGTCFFRREGYVDESGQEGSDFISSMPDSFSNQGWLGLHQ